MVLIWLTGGLGFLLSPLTSLLCGLRYRQGLERSLGWFFIAFLVNPFLIVLVGSITSAANISGIITFLLYPLLVGFVDVTTLPTISWIIVLNFEFIVLSCVWWSVWRWVCLRDGKINPPVP